MNSAIARYFRLGHISMAPMLSLKDIFQRPRTQLFPMSKGLHRVVETFNGSAALHQVATAIGVTQEDVVLIPAYCCGAELGPFLHMKCRCDFFDVDENLQCDVDQIEQLLQKHSHVKAVMITHFFGFRQVNSQRLFELCEQHDIALIEDCAHSLFSFSKENALGSVGHFAIFSPRKSLPMTEGGLMVINHSDLDIAQNHLESPALIPRLHRFVYSMQQNLRNGVLVDTTLWRRSLRVIKLAVLALPAIALKLLQKLPLLSNTVWLTADAEGEEAVPIYCVGMSKTASNILSRAKSESVIKARRENYKVWLNEIERIQSSTVGLSQTLAKPLLPKLPADCCPLYFPVVVPNPAHVKQFLAERDIECFNWWQHMHPAVEWSRFPVASRLKNSVIALPIHQKLNTAQIQIMAKCFEKSLVGP